MAKSSTTQSIDALMNEIEKDVYFLPLRNALAHNREFNDVVVKDAEASILWFSAALRKLT